MIADGARAGLVRQASSGLPNRSPFPAATTTGMPARVAAATAESSAPDTPPPRLRLITERPAGLCWTAQSIPAITSETLPLPTQSSTRTGTRLTSLATP